MAAGMLTVDVSPSEIPISSRGKITPAARAATAYGKGTTQVAKRRGEFMGTEPDPDGKEAAT
jgi:hypothetical protein